MKYVQSIVWQKLIQSEKHISSTWSVCLFFFCSLRQIFNQENFYSTEATQRKCVHYTFKMLLIVQLTQILLWQQSDYPRFIQYICSIVTSGLATLPLIHSNRCLVNPICMAFSVRFSSSLSLSLRFPSKNTAEYPSK